MKAADPVDLVWYRGSASSSVCGRPLPPACIC